MRRSCAIQLDSHTNAKEASLRVLLVEDEASLAKQLASALGAAGYAVDCAADGAAADFLGHTEPYDAVILDLGLAGLYGGSIALAGSPAGGLRATLQLPS